MTLADLKGKRFAYGVIAVVAASIVSVLLKYPGEIYLKVITIITSIFVAGQTVTDFQKNGGKAQ